MKFPAQGFSQYGGLSTISSLPNYPSPVPYTPQFARFSWDVAHSLKCGWQTRGHCQQPDLGLC